MSIELQSFLAEQDVRLIPLRTLKETLMMLQNLRVDVMLLDSNLLEEDCGFISIIKGIAENIRIIICAENNSPEFEINARQKKIFYYHINSFGTQDLEVAISNAINYSPHHAGGSSYVITG